MDIIRVALGIVIQDGRCLVAQRLELGPFEGLWEFPGGKIEPKESSRRALARELEEEVGIVDRDFEEANDRTAYWRNTFASGGSLLAGYRVKRSNIIYLRTGASFGTFEKEGQKEETMSKIALQYGLGGETVVTKRFSFRVEYSRDRYADMTPSDEHFTFAVNFYI